MQFLCNNCNQNDNYAMKMYWMGIKKSRFVKVQGANGLLSNLGIKTPMSKIPLLNVLF